MPRRGHGEHQNLQASVVAQRRAEHHHESVCNHRDEALVDDRLGVALDLEHKDDRGGVARVQLHRSVLHAPVGLLVELAHVQVAGEGRSHESSAVVLLDRELSAIDQRHLYRTAPP